MRKTVWRRCRHIASSLQSTNSELSVRKGFDSDGDYHQLRRHYRPPNDLSSIHANDLGQRGVGHLGIGDDPWTEEVVRQKQVRECQGTRNNVIRNVQKFENPP